MPVDFEIAICSGSFIVPLLHPLDVTHTGDTANRSGQALELFLVADLDRNVDDRAVTAALVIGARFESSYVAVLIEQDRCELIQHAGPIVRIDDDFHGE